MEQNNNTPIEEEVSPSLTTDETTSITSPELSQPQYITPLYSNSASVKWLRQGTIYYELCCELYTNELTNEFKRFHKTLQEACLELIQIEREYKSKIVYIGLLSRKKQTPIGEYDK